jgi:hypothetical protein
MSRNYLREEDFGKHNNLIGMTHRYIYIKYIFNIYICGMTSVNLLKK